jgi:hypothetical protein
MKTIIHHYPIFDADNSTNCPEANYPFDLCPYQAMQDLGSEKLYTYIDMNRGIFQQFTIRKEL